MRSRPTEDGVALSVLFDQLMRLRKAGGSRLPTYAEHAMVCLGMQPSLSLGFAELRRALHLGQSRASRLCIALESIGWVRVTSHPEDARKSLVKLTATGRRVVDALKHSGETTPNN